jgi:hypothetical protein
MQEEIDKQAKVQRQVELERAPNAPHQPNAPPPKIPPLPVITPQMISAILAVTFAMTAAVMVLLPAVFLVFYQRAAVRATCRRRDPQVRWTDRCPLPVLAVSVALALSAMWMLFSAVGQPVVPLFGGLIAGPAGAGLMLLLALVSVWLAWASYRLKMHAWWGTLLWWAVWIVSSVVTFSRPGVMEKMYEKMNIPAVELEAIRKAGLFDSMANERWLYLLMGVGVVCYLLYVRRYFVRGGGPEETTSAANV